MTSRAKFIQGFLDRARTIPGWREVFEPGPAPPRVAKAIRQAEWTAEIFVGWVQLTGVILFAAVYLVAQTAFESIGRFDPIPITLAVYGGFVGWRLRTAYKAGLTRRLLVLSTIADISVLMVLIWGFTLQYELPPALYLKAPTLLYVFILIALRALRFSPGHVLLAGGLAAFGWAALVLLAAFGPEPAPQTTDYRVYMTSLSLLWGAEAEKITAILATTGILALAVSRARALLVQTNVEAMAAADLSRFMDRAAAAQVRASEGALEPGDGELRAATICFFDLGGFSAAAAKLEPREVIALLQDYHRRFVPVIEASGGSVDKYLGDGILVSYGAAAVTGREAAQAVEAVPALLETMEAWAAERSAAGLPALSVRVAMAAGDVVYGVMGHADRLEFTVIGDAVNQAAKLEKHAKSEGARVIATRDLLVRAAAQGARVSPLRNCPGAAVEGLSAPVDLVVLG